MSDTTRPRPPLWRICIRYGLYFIGLLFLFVVMAFFVMGSGGQAAIDKARAYASTEDPNFRWSDAFKKFPTVPAENDVFQDVLKAGLAVAVQGQWPCRNRIEFDRVLRFVDPKSYDAISEITCNHRLREAELAALKKSMADMTIPFMYAKNGANKTAIQFLPELDTFMGYSVKMSQIQALYFMGEAYRQHAIYLCLTNGANVWDSMKEVLRLDGFITDPGLRTLGWRNKTLDSLLIAAEYLLAQRQYTDAELASFEEKLRQRLNDNTLLKAGLFYLRADADHQLDKLATDDSEFKKQFSWLLGLAKPSIQHSLAETITITTDLLKLEPLNTVTVYTWLDAYIKRYHERDEAMSALNYPYHYFLHYQLPRLKKTLQDCRGEQESVRLTLLVLVCERHRLKTGAFPATIQEARQLLPKATRDVFDLMGDTHQLTTTDFGIVLHPKQTVATDRSKHEQLTVNTYWHTGKYGFKLYMPEHRGKAAPPPPPKEEDPFGSLSDK
jgi:hypothetical protein